MIISNYDVGKVSERFFSLRSYGKGLFFECDVFAILPSGYCDVFYERMFTFGLTGSKIERTVPPIGKVVGGILLEGGILMTGKLIYGSVPDRLAIRCVNEERP